LSGPPALGFDAFKTRSPAVSVNINGVACLSDRRWSSTLLPYVVGRHIN